MKLQQGLDRLAGAGLNVYASMPLADLPADLQSYFTPFSAYQSLCVFGHGGRSLWENLPKPVQAETHPVDSFVLSQLNMFMHQTVGEALILYPGTNILLPLQKLGHALNLSRPSLLGLDIHPEFGLWFAYRAVMLTKTLLPKQMGSATHAACERCLEKPCRSACPVGAVGESANLFALKTCVNHRLSEESVCAETCLSRLACPEGASHRYSPEQIQYHMGRPSHQRKLSEYK